MKEDSIKDLPVELGKEGALNYGVAEQKEALKLVDGILDAIKNKGFSTTDDNIKFTLNEIKNKGLNFHKISRKESFLSRFFLAPFIFDTPENKDETNDLLVENYRNLVNNIDGYMENLRTFKQIILKESTYFEYLYENLLRGTKGLELLIIPTLNPTEEARPLLKKRIYDIKLTLGILEKNSTIVSLIINANKEFVQEVDLHLIKKLSVLKEDIKGLIRSIQGVARQLPLATRAMVKEKSNIKRQRDRERAISSKEFKKLKKDCKDTVGCVDNLLKGPKRDKTKWLSSLLIKGSG